MAEHNGQPEWANDLPPFLTAKNIEAILQIDEKTIYKHAKDDDLPSKKIGRTVRFPKDEFLKWLDQKDRRKKR